MEKEKKVLSTEQEMRARMESDMKEINVMVQKMSGYQGVTYDTKTHPGRRAGDEGAEKPAWF